MHNHNHALRHINKQRDTPSTSRQNFMKGHTYTHQQLRIILKYQCYQNNIRRSKSINHRLPQISATRPNRSSCIVNKDMHNSRHMLQQSTHTRTPRCLLPGFLCTGNKTTSPVSYRRAASLPRNFKAETFWHVKTNHNACKPSTHFSQLFTSI